MKGDDLQNARKRNPASTAPRCVPVSWRWHPCLFCRNGCNCMTDKSTVRTFGECNVNSFKSPVATQSAAVSEEPRTDTFQRFLRIHLFAQKTRNIWSHHIAAVSLRASACTCGPKTHFKTRCFKNAYFAMSKAFAFRELSGRHAWTASVGCLGESKRSHCVSINLRVSVCSRT